MTGPIRYTTRDAFAEMASVKLADPEGDVIIGPSKGFDVYSGLRAIMGFCKCTQCTADLIDTIARRRIVRRSVRR